MSTARVVLTVGFVALALTGCAGAGDGPGGGEGDAADLVGMWKVADAQGEGDATWLRMDVVELRLLRDCGVLSGSWRSADDTFLGVTDGWPAECGDDEPAVPWLADAVAFRVSDDTVALLGEDGAVVATLTHDGAPDPSDVWTEDDTSVPTPDADTLAALVDEPAAVPSGMTAATSEGIVGAWVPEGLTVSTEPGVTFDENGTYSASDGCNGSGGRWAVGDDGRFLATSGASTMMGCEGAPVPSWVAGASRAAFDGQTLVLLDADGTELGRLVAA
ncbi:META domain-containing protein [Cellulomonas composti]|uniref:DUF306 domain-containing protein n=1 Tax=Cellulomonas composti TaxID=266130 RepID=A0A511J8C6_9CELL|nr:META domain-containing protein [Cellulomonas composti]GEL93963.1 hypothetical protein CCO02nite_06210 [Cellulomonas composti]